MYGIRYDVENRLNEIYNWIKENKSIYYMTTQLGCRYETLKRVFDKYNINYKGHTPIKGKTNNYFDLTNKPISYYLTNNSVIKPYKLKLKLIKEGIKDAKCEVCGNTTWLGKEIPLELHHIDGNHFNNSLENLQLLCPNCHALTPNYKRNRVKKKETFKAFDDLYNKRAILLKNSKIDFSKYGVGVEVAKLFGITPQSAMRYMKKNFSEYLK